MTDDPMTGVPRYALFRGRKVRIANYLPGATAPFLIIDTDDSKRSVTREQLTFLTTKPAAQRMAVSAPKLQQTRRPVPPLEELF